MQMQNVALPRQEVVFDIETIHGLEMTPQDRDRNHIRDSGTFVVAFLDGMQRLLANLQVLLVLGVPVRDAGVEVPAVVVETRLASQLLDFGPRLLLDMQKSHHHVGNLHAGVVDVVLNIHFPAGESQQPHKSVAENGVAQMPDVRRLVGIDAGVLDQNLARGDFGGRGFSSAIRAAARSSRLSRALMYPAPANSSFSKPAIGPIPLTISSAILRGALRSFLASSKARGNRVLAEFTLGGCSMTILARSSAYVRRRNSRTCWASRRSRWRYKNSPKLLKKRVIVANCTRTARFDAECCVPYDENCRWSWSLAVG